MKRCASLVLCMAVSGILLIIVGTVSNTAAVLANDGRMPVRCHNEEWRIHYERTSVTPGTIHSVLTEESRLPFLCDQFLIFGHMQSVGDIALSAGCALFFADILLILIITSTIVPSKTITFRFSQPSS